MSLPTVLQAGRAAAERLMVDTFTAWAPGGRAVVDGYEVPAFTLMYSTAGKVQGSRDPNTRWVTVGDTQHPVVETTLHIPFDAAAPAVDWEFECTAVGVGSDPALIGRRWRVINAPVKSQATARRLDVVEVQPQVEVAP